MSKYLAPHNSIEEVSTGRRPIEAVGTSTAAFIGVAPNEGAFPNDARAVNNWSEFLREFSSDGAASTDLSHAVFGFFENGGRRCFVVNVERGQPIAGARTTGLRRLEALDEVAIVASPGYADAASYDALLGHCEAMKDRMAILDPPEEVARLEQLTRVATAGVSRRRGGRTEGGGEPAGEDAVATAAEGAALRGVRPRVSDGGYGALYAPRIIVRDPLSPSGDTVTVPPSGHVAGIYARTDAARGVHKAPANASVRGALNVTYHLTREEQDTLNSAGVNGIRFVPNKGIRVWGARTLAPSASEWRYVPVRRLINMIEKSIAKGTRWVVFEPNDRQLWKDIRRDVRAFLRTLWRDGALMGRTEREAFFVQCDDETNPRESIEQGRVVVVIGVAPLKPAEFITVRIVHHAGGVPT